jgi:hypothetical protein
MVKQLKLKNFRGVKKGEIKLGEDLTILVGSNNAAKTTILEALFLLPNPLRLVPYYGSRGGDFTAASLVNEMHQTLDSNGYAFLLYKYIANEAEIEGDDNWLKFVEEQYNIFITTKATEKFKTSSFKTLKGDIFYFGRLDRTTEGSDFVHPENGKNLIIPNSLLISSDFSKFAYLYMQRNWGSIMNLGILKEVATDISHMLNENYINITIEPFMGGRLAIFGFLEDGSRIRVSVQRLAGVKVIYSKS